ncbi:MAG: DNRLRE domain-containing protein [Clostridia bacterium]|nr:DNRLRE domain-containing protein [Clostridia bacterium]
MKTVLRCISVLLALLLIVQAAPVNDSVFCMLKAAATELPEEELLPEEEPEEIPEEEPEDLIVPPEAVILSEDTALRTAGTKTFILSDGTRQACVYNDAVHFEAEDGAFTDYDNTLKETPEGDAFMPGANSAGYRISKSTENEALVSVSKDGAFLSWTYDGIRAQTAQIAEQKPDDDPTTPDAFTAEASFCDVFDETDLQYRLYGGNMKEDLILRTYAAPHNFTVRYRYENVTPQLQADGKTLCFVTPEGESAFTVTAPYMTDAEGNASSELSLVLSEEKENEIAFTLTPDEAWLADPARAYPVTIDPVVETDRSFTNGGQSAFILSDHPEDCYGLGGNSYVGSLYVGKYIYQSINGDARAFLKINMPDLGVGARIVSAEMLTRLRRCDLSITITLHKVLEPWVQSEICWAQSPDYDATVSEYKVIAANSLTMQDIYWDITALADAWYQNPASNYGVMLKSDAAEAGNTSNVAWFYSSHYTNGPTYETQDENYRPQLIINYRNTSGYEDYYTYSGVSAGRGGNADVNLYNGNLVVSQPVTTATGGERMPVSLQLTYNANKHTDTNGQAFQNPLGAVGAGWKLNYQMYICQNPNLTASSSAEARKYRYYLDDADGTQHYFYFASEEDTSGFDEDGLGYTLTVNTDGTFILDDLKKNKMYFNTLGYLTEVQDPYGQSILLTYNNSNKLTCITDGVGRQYTLSYSGSKISAITAPGNNVTLFSYTGSNLTQIQFQDGKKIYYTYSSLLTAVTEIDGITVNVGYDNTVMHRVSALSRVGGNETGASYTLTYRQNETDVTSLSQTSAPDQTQTYQFDSYGHCTGVISLSSGEAAAYTHNPGNTALRTANRTTDASRIQKSVRNYVRNPSLNGTLNSAFSVYHSQAADTSTVTKDTTVGHYEKGSVKIYRPSTDVGLSVALQHITNLDAGVYTASAFVTTNGSSLSGAAPVLFMEVWSASNTYVARYKAEGITGTAANEWTRQTLTVNLSAGQWVKLEVGLNASGSGTVWVDDIQFEKGAGVSAFNLLQNPEFKQSQTGWTSNGTTSISSEAPGGFTNSMKLTLSPGTAKNISQTVPLNSTAGVCFSVGAWVKANSVPLTDKSSNAANLNARLDLQAELLAQDGATVVTSASAAANPFVAGWQFISLPIKATGAYAYIRISVVADNNANAVYTTGLYCLAEEYGETYVYDADGNLISVADVSANTQNYGYASDVLTASSAATGVGSVASYDESTNRLVAVLSKDDTRRIDYHNTNYGLVTTSRYGSIDFARQVTANESYYIVNVANGKAITVNNTTTASDVKNASWYFSKAAQKWTFVPTGTAGEYYIKLANTTLALTVKNGSSADSAILRGETFSSGSSKQKFKVQYVDQIGFKISTAVTSYASVVDSNAMNLQQISNGNLIRQKHYTGSSTQHWYLAAVCGDITEAPYLETKTGYTSNWNYVNSSTNAAGNTVNYTYNTTTGLLQSVTDPRGATTSYTYNAMGAVTNVQSGTLSASYGYTNDRLTSIQNNGNTYTVSYDALGRTEMVEVGEQFLSGVLYENNLPSASAIGHHMEEYTYDDEITGRIAKTTYTNLLTDDSFEQNYYYGANGQLTMTTDTAANTRTAYIYDLAGRPVSERTYYSTYLQANTLKASLDYTYNNQNQVTALKAYTPLGSDTLTLTYGSFESGQKPGYLYQEKYNGNTLLNYSYDGLGRLSSKTVHGNLVYSYGYRNLTGNRTTPQIQTLTTPIGTYTYTYDANGNILTETLGSYTTSYVYDSFNRLTRENNQKAGYTYVYTYDNDNIKTRKTYAYTTGTPGTVLNTDTWTYDTNWKDLLNAYNDDDLYSLNGELRLVYNDNGNAAKSALYEWNRQGLLQSYADSVSGDAFSYTYDANGKRLTKTVNGATTNYYYAGGRMVGLMTGTNAMRFRLSASGEYIGFTYGGNAYYYVKNLQGDVVDIVNIYGYSVVQYTYDAWGRILSVTGSRANDLGVINPFRYRGYMYDEETGLYFLTTRYYNPEWGRFLTFDTTLGANGDIHSYNLFAYCSWNPVNYYDDAGTRAVPIWEKYGFVYKGSEDIINMKHDLPPQEFQRWIQTGGRHIVNISTDNEFGPVILFSHVDYYTPAQADEYYISELEKASKNSLFDILSAAMSIALTSISPYAPELAGIIILFCDIILACLPILSIAYKYKSNMDLESFKAAKESGNGVFVEYYYYYYPDGSMGVNTYESTVILPGVAL